MLLILPSVVGAGSPHVDAGQLDARRPPTATADAVRLGIAFSHTVVVPASTPPVHSHTRGLARSPDGAGASGVGAAAANGDGRGECTEGSKNEQGPHHDLCLGGRIMESFGFSTS